MTYKDLNGNGTSKLIFICLKGRSKKSVIRFRYLESLMQDSHLLSAFMTLTVILYQDFSLFSRLKVCEILGLFKLSSLETNYWMLEE